MLGNPERGRYRVGRWRAIERSCGCEQGAASAAVAGNPARRVDARAEDIRQVIYLGDLHGVAGDRDSRRASSGGINQLLSLEDCITEERVAEC